MKHIILKELELINFKGEEHRITDFKEDVTTIVGRNGVGKSRHFDAFIWLLFGRDTNDRKDYEIKTRINGEELHDVDCGVNGTLSIDGVTVVLKRRIVETYMNGQDDGERVFKGNRTACWWDDVPVTTTEYTRRIQEIILPDLFRMITNPLYFPMMKWQDQRDLLFRIAGGVSDEELLKKDRYKDLKAFMGMRSIADAQKALATQRKDLKAKLTAIQPRINQARSLMPEHEDFEALHKEYDEIKQELDETENNMQNQSLALQKANSERFNKINELKFKRQEVFTRVKMNAQKEKLENESEIQEKEAEIKAVQREMERIKRDEVKYGDTIIRLAVRIEDIKKEQEVLRNKWRETNAREWDGSDVCPFCHQRMPQEMVEAAANSFNDTKKKECDKINDDGVRLKKEVEKNNEEIKELNEAISKGHDIIADKEKVLNALKSSLKALQSIVITLPNIDTIQECNAITDEINKLSAQVGPDAYISELGQRKAELSKRLSTITERLYKEKRIAEINAAIEAIKKEGRGLSLALAGIDNLEKCMEEFRMEKAKACEAKINGMFRHVTFKLYDYTIAGNPVETCVPFVKGVPFWTTNTAGKINAGLDIINTLCNFYGICAPIFIDGRESILNLIDTPCQIINLKVTEDEQLKVL